MRPISGSGPRTQAAVVCQYWGSHHNKTQRDERNSKTQALAGETQKVVGLEIA